MSEYKTNAPCEDIDQKWYKRFDKILADPALEGRIIDIGAQHGTLAFRLAEQYDVTAIDIDAENVEVMQTLAKQKELDIQIRQCAIQSLPFEDNSFDTVILSQVVEHVRNPEDMSELMRILKASGAIIVTTNLGFAHWSPDHCWFFLPRDVYKFLYHGWFFMTDQQKKYTFLKCHTVVPFEDYFIKYFSPWFEYQLYEARESRWNGIEIYARVYKTSQTHPFPLLQGEVLWREIKSDALAELTLSSPNTVHRR